MDHVTGQVIDHEIVMNGTQIQCNSQSFFNEPFSMTIWSWDFRFYELDNGESDLTDLIIGHVIGHLIDHEIVLNGTQM